MTGLTTNLKCKDKNTEHRLGGKQNAERRRNRSPSQRVTGQGLGSGLGWGWTERHSKIKTHFQNKGLGQG